MAVATQTPPWGIKVKQMLLEKSMSITQLAEDLGYDRVWVSQVINGRKQSADLKDKICHYLGLDNVSS